MIMMYLYHLFKQSRTLCFFLFYSQAGIPHFIVVLPISTLDQRIQVGEEKTALY